MLVAVTTTPNENVGLAVDSAPAQLSMTIPLRGNPGTRNSWRLTERLPLVGQLLMNKVDEQGSEPLFYSNADGFARKANEVIVCVAEHTLNL